MMTGVVLAGGRSRRMGSDKTQLAWGDGTLLSAAVDKLAGLCAEIVIVGPQQEVGRAVRWTTDRYVGAGPLAGLEAGLAAASFDSVLVLACDMPAVPTELLCNISQFSRRSDLVLPVHARGYEPLCAWYKRQACLAAAERLLREGNWRLQAMRQAVASVAYAVEEYYPAGGERLFANLNTRTEYEAALVRAALTVDRVAS